MVWRNEKSGSNIPASAKHIVRLRQDNKCVGLYPQLCTGALEEYDHVVNVAALRIERSHANDPALLQGLCVPCHRAKTQQ